MSSSRSFDIMQTLESGNLFDPPGTIDYGNALWPNEAKAAWESLAPLNDSLVNETVMEFAEAVCDEGEDDETGFLGDTVAETSANIMDVSHWTCVHVSLPDGVKVFTFWNSKIEHLGLFLADDGTAGSFLPV